MTVRAIFLVLKSMLLIGGRLIPAPGDAEMISALTNSLLRKNAYNSSVCLRTRFRPALRSELLDLGPSNMSLLVGIAWRRGDGYLFFADGV